MAVSTTKIVSVKLEVLPEEAIQNIQAARKRIDELKEDMAILKLTGKQNTDQFIAMEVELKSLNGVIKANQNVLQNSITAMSGNGDSLAALRAELANLQRAYDDLSATEQYFGEGIKMQAKIEELQSSIKEMEGITGRFGRSIGDYEGAIKRALEGELPLKGAIKEIRNSLATLNLQYNESSKKIDEQKQKMQELANTVGADSDEYKEASLQLEKMESDYKSLGDTITEMTAKAGELDDVMSDTSKSIKNAGADAAQWTAAKEGAEVLLNSYTALQAGMVALGIESDELINIFAKLQVLQQGLNAINQIAQALQKESILRQQLQVLWTNLTTKSLGSLIAAKKQDAAASATATAATTALATGEGVATASSFTLVGALNAVKVAIMNIPIIGWILAAVAALGTLIGLVVKSNKESEEGIELQERASENLERQNKQYEEVDSKVVEIRNDLDTLNGILQKSDKNTQIYKDTLKKLGQELGVQITDQQVGTETLNKLEDVHIKLKRAELQQEFDQNQYIADRNKLQQINNVLSAAATLDQKQRKQFIEDELGISEKAAASYAAAIHQGMKEGKTWQDALAEGNDATAASFARLTKSVDSYAEKSKKDTDAIIAINAEMDKIIEEGGLKRIESAKNASKSVVDRAKKEIEERRKLEDLALDMMEDTIEKQIGVYKKGIERQIEDLKLKLKTEKNLTVAAREAVNKQIEALEEIKEKKVAEIRKKYAADELKAMLKQSKERYDFMLKNVNSDSEAAKILSTELVNIEEEAQKEALDTWKKSEEEKLQFWFDTNNKEAKDREATLKILGLTEQEFNEQLKQAQDKQLAVNVEYNNRKLANDRYYQKKREQIEKDFEKKKKKDKFEAGDVAKEADFAKRLNEIELSNFDDKEVRKTQILLEQAQYREGIAKQEVDRLESLTSEEITAMYGTMEAYELALANANARLVEEQINVKNAMKEASKAIKTQKQETLSNAIVIGNAIEGMLGNIGDLFNTLAESNDKYNDFATGMAMAQILVSSAVSIAQAIQAAVQAGGFTGPGAVVTIPVFIAELVGIVASGIASAVATLKKAKEAKTSKPRFKEGGLIDRGESGVDRVPILATRGEYVIKKNRVDELGVDFLDKLNGGNIGLSSSGRYANGGVVVEGINNPTQGINYDAIREVMIEAVSEVQPVVSVKEITKAQNRTKLKQAISAK